MHRGAERSAEGSGFRSGLKSVNCRAVRTNVRGKERKERGKGQIKERKSWRGMWNGAGLSSD